MPQALRNALGDTLTLPNTLFIRGFNRSTPVNTVDLTTGDVVVRPSVRRATTGVLTGTLIGSSYVDAQSQLDDLLGFMQHTPLRFHKHGLSSRYIVVHPQGASDEGTVTARAASVNIPLIAPDPLWVGDARSYTQEISSVPTTFTVTNGGNAPAHPIIRLVGRSAAGHVTRIPELENATTGRHIQFGGLLSQAQVLTLNSAERTAIQGSEGKLNEVNTEYLVYGFPLAPGANSITVHLTSPTAAVRVEFEWNDRWL